MWEYYIKISDEKMLVSAFQYVNSHVNKFSLILRFIKNDLS
jgi:hypothetical protein